MRVSEVKESQSGQSRGLHSSGAAPAVQAEFDEITRGNLRIVTASLSLLFLVYSVGHLFLLPRQIRLWMFSLALATSLAMAGMRWWLGRPGYPLRLTNQTFGLVVGLTLLNCLAHLALTREPRQTTNLIILVCSVGFFSLSLRWLVAVILASFTGWALVVATSVNEDWIHFGFALVAASLLALVVNLYRLRVFRRLVTLRLKEEEQREQMEESLAVAEKARREAVAARQAMEEMVAKVRRTEERFRTFTELEGIAIHESGEILDANPVLAEMFRYDPLEILRLATLSLVAPESRDLLQAHLRGGDDKPYETIGLRKDGTTFPIEICTRATPYRGHRASVISIRDISGRYDAMRKLRESEERYRDLFELSPLPMAVVDHETEGFLAVNQAAIHHYGYTREEFLRMTIRELYRPEDVPGVVERFRRPRTGLNTFGHSRQVIRDGSPIDVEITTHDISWAGKPARLVLANDVTERMRAEQELRDSEARYRHIFEISPVPMWVYDLETKAFLAVNQAATRHYGYSRQEFLSMTASDIRPPEDVARFMEVSAKDPRGIKNSGVWRHVKKDGTVMQVVINSHELTFGGRPARMVVASDITARKRVEQALRSYAERLRILREIDQAILAAESPEAIANAVLPKLQRLIPFDRASVTTFEEESEAVLIALVTSLRTDFNVGARFRMTPARTEELRRSRMVAVDDVNELAAPSLGQETIRKEGLRTYVNVPIIWQRKLIASINLGAIKACAFTPEQLDIAADVADLLAVAFQQANLYAAERKARAEAEMADRLKDDFLATVSHELRTPLNAIVGWNHLLSTRKLAPEIAQRGYETIERNAKAQSRLINDLLDVSRIISGRLRLNVRMLEMTPLVETTIDAVRPAAEAKTIAIETSFDPAAGLVSGDPDRLQQVLWNLLQNAIKFTPAGGRVRVSLEGRGHHLHLVVSDTGKGISPEFLPCVFERFRQGDSSATRVYGGLGLGLSIVRHLVELQGGTVRAESPGEGLGATFTVSLPLAELRVSEHGLRIEGSLSEEVTVPPPALLAGAHVLVVEDEPDTREMLKLLLAQYGASAITTSSAAEALALLDEWLPDLIISDLAMPDRDGYWLIDGVRKLNAATGRNIPAIALTAYAKAEDRARALGAGFQLHIAKPFEPEHLAEAVARLLGRQREGQTSTPEQGLNKA
ncbi:MAG TPA: PAS domain S-box protein [Blastocatellia bacterium]|nr:PAS domain S-box protein [Blastocatellia bacterium]